MILSTLFCVGLTAAATIPSRLSTRDASNASSPGLLINTTSGLVQGFVNSTAPNVRQFLGIPYAQPPVGNLRFAPPQDLAYKTGTINATALPNSCMQQYSNGSTVFTTYAYEFLISGGQSEDCLYLSIWAPDEQVIADQQVPLPVFVYIPGGGFTSGGQNSMYKIPDKWVQRTQSHIVVIMNYRVNVFGWPFAAGLDSQNLGFRDQRKVVEWVYQNIAQFGGDPTRITLWGQSAGAGSVAAYPYAWPDNPIVTGLIADSGATGIISAVKNNGSAFTHLASLVGCGGLNATAELACVRSVDAVYLEQTLSNYSISGQKPAIAFAPAPDGELVFANYTERLVKGYLAKIPLLIGSNKNEGAGFVPFTQSGPGNATLFNTTENIIACPVASDVQRRNLRAHQYPTYRYQYTGNFTNISPLPWFGAYHSSELPLVFGTHYEYGPGNSTAFEYDVSHGMEALWLSFASDPTAGPKRVSRNVSTGTLDYFAWPRFHQGGNDLVVFAENNQVLQLAQAGPRIDNYCPGF